MLWRAEGLALLAALALCFLGWGRIWRRTFRMEPGSWPVTMALGMAVVLFFGGILNALHLTRAPGLIVILALGLVFSLPGFRVAKLTASRASMYIFIAALLAVPLITQFPPRAFNFDDDFQKYFTHVARMVQTGTANGGGPFSSLGFDTLGGQAWLQSFLGAFLPIAYVNGLDAVLGLFLCLALAVEFAAAPAIAVVAALSVVAINPQYVNVSALYTGTGLMMAIFSISTDPRERPHPIAAGLLFAGLIALKSTFGLFVVLLLALIALGVLLADGFAKAARWTAAASTSSVVFLAPWVMPHLLDLRKSMTRGGGSGGMGPPAGLRDPFSIDALPYGASVAAYTMLVIAVLCGALAIGWAARRRETPMVAAFGVATVAAYVLLVFVVAPRSYGLEHSLRYFIPLLLAVVPAVIGIAVRCWPSRQGWIVVAAVVVLTPFAPSFASRTRQAFASGSVLAFWWLATEPDYLDYNQRVLTGPERGRISALQAAVPPGEPVLAWIGAPFYLNYGRNPILDSESCGLCDPRAELPEFRYVIWEYHGYSSKSAKGYEEQALDPDAGAQMRAVSAHWLELQMQMTRWRESGRTLYDDGGIAVVQLIR